MRFDFPFFSTVSQSNKPGENNSMYSCHNAIDFSPYAKQVLVLMNNLWRHILHLNCYALPIKLFYKSCLNYNKDNDYF